MLLAGMVLVLVLVLVLTLLVLLPKPGQPFTDVLDVFVELREQHGARVRLRQAVILGRCAHLAEEGRLRTCITV